MKNKDLNKITAFIVKQFLCCVPLRSFDWRNFFENLTYEYQEILISETVNSELVLKHPTDINYQKAFLKYIIEKLEKNSEIHDELYSAFGRLVALPVLDQYYKHYYIEKSGNVVSLKENVNIISEGTTGLRTWQASLALSEWVLQNVGFFNNKSVLELGSGIGLTGLVIAKECSPDCIYLTDCHSSVLKILCENVKLNTGNISHNSENELLEKDGTLVDRCSYTLFENETIHVLNLPWENINEEACLKLGIINTVIAADVVYDNELFEPLINALKCLAEYSKVKEFVFSCTERNKQTLNSFLDQITEASFHVDERDVPAQENFIWPVDTPIRIFSFTPL